jgi:hypothetical protein
VLIFEVGIKMAQLKSWLSKMENKPEKSVIVLREEADLGF